MKLKHILITLLSVCLVLSLAACGGGETAETTAGDSATAAPATEAATDAPTDAATEAPKTEAPTEAPATEASTEASTTEGSDAVTTAPEGGDATEGDEEGDDVLDPDKKYREDWDEDDPMNPYYNLITVGTSYDGVTTAYDGRFDFGVNVCVAGDGQAFSSVQEAIYYLEDYSGGGTITIASDIGMCLSLTFPEYGSYIIYYNFMNVDFIYNYGNIYDDCTPNVDNINGYAYYSSLTALDGIQGLNNTYVWMLGGNEDFPDAGCYRILDGANNGYNYQYVPDLALELWPGLPKGEN